MSESSDDDGVKVDIESARYSQVVFIDVPPCFPQNTDVICSYKLTEGLIPNAKDWIGIYKVGWESVAKYHSYEWTKPCMEYNRCEQQIVFKKNNLPMDDNEFYQFCYVDSMCQVRGASTPFSFQNLAETSEDCSLLVVSTQEQVEQMEKEKEALLAEIEQLKEGKAIIKNELDERLQEIHRLRMCIEKLKSEGRSDTVPLKEQPESPQQDTLKTSLLSVTVTETKAEQELPTCVHENYEKAIRMISFLKQEKMQLERQVIEKDAEISKLRPMAQKTEQEYNRLQDQFQLQQVDMLSIQKDKERLCAEIERLKVDRERLQEENKELNVTASKQEPSDGDKNATNMQILSLTNELREVRGALRKEIQNSTEANSRAENAELQMRELKVQLEKKAAAEKSLAGMETVEASSRHHEETSTAVVAQLENENKKLRDEIERLELMIQELTPQAENPSTPAPASPIDTQQHYQLDPYPFENISEPYEYPSDAGNQAMVCRHCQESFPDITEYELVAHEQSHKVCPFCTLIWDDCGQQEFEDHVYSHEE